LRSIRRRSDPDPRFAGEPGTRKKVVIDCDPGVDDALALILAFHSPELEVETITGVNGNVPLDLVFENIRKVLSLIQPQRKPFIAKGSDRPLKGKPVYAHSFHGGDGLGGAEIVQRKGAEYWRVHPFRAEELILQMAYQYPDEITLIALGPLTNLALGIQRDPDGMGMLKEVVVMGGAVRTGGNVTPHAEFNFFVDPLAARTVFESGLPITLVPLDVTHQVFLTAEAIEERVRPINNEFSNFLLESTGYDFTTHEFRDKSGSFFLHDPLAVGVAIDPALVRTERLSLRVETEEGERYGALSEVPGGPAVEACLDVNSERFLQLFLSGLV
jgi:inosine-uridine nucleoside N-ribohydrolase